MAQSKISAPLWLQLMSPLGGGSAIVCPFYSVLCGDFEFLFCTVVHSVLSSFTEIWMSKRSGSLRVLCSCCHVAVRVLCLSHMVP